MIQDYGGMVQVEKIFLRLFIGSIASRTISLVSCILPGYLLLIPSIQSLHLVQPGDVMMLNTYGHLVFKKLHSFGLLQSYVDGPTLVQFHQD